MVRPFTQYWTRWHIFPNWYGILTCPSPSPLTTYLLPSVRTQHPSSVVFGLSQLPLKDPRSLLNGPPSPPTSAHYMPTLDLTPCPHASSAPHLAPWLLSTKRKRCDDEEVAICKRLRPGQPLTCQALRSLGGNMGDVSKQNQDQVRSEVCIVTSSPLRHATGTR